MDWALRLPSVWRVIAWACLRPPWHTVQAAVVRRNCSGETVQTKARAQRDLQTREELLPPEAQWLSLVVRQWSAAACRLLNASVRWGRACVPR